LRAGHPPASLLAPKSLYSQGTAVWLNLGYNCSLEGPMSKNSLPILAFVCALFITACDRGSAAIGGGVSTTDPDSLAGELRAGVDPAEVGLAVDTAGAHPGRQAGAGPRASAPPILRGIYLNAYAAGSRARLANLLALADSTEINAFVIDVKDERGVHYTSALPLAQELLQDGENTLRDLPAFIERIRPHNVWTMARIVVFKDPILSKARPAWSIRNPSGGIWTDRAGNTWVSPWNRDVWEYNLAIAEEAARAGFNEIQFDYIRFPEPYASLPAQVHPNAPANADRTEAIVQFLAEARRRLHPLGVVVSADVFGLSPNDPRDINIGQQWEEVLAAADHILPMVYPSHYFPTHLRGVPRPNRMPYETVFASVGMGMVRERRLRDAGVTTARVIPWLQAFNAPWVDRDYPYGPEQAAAQVRGVYDVGLEDWVFWHPGSRYEQISAAFARELKPRAVEFEPLPALVQQVDALERQGVQAGRERAVERQGGTSARSAATAATTAAPAASPPGAVPGSGSN
jgi:hypothetical protein